MSQISAQDQEKTFKIWESLLRDMVRILNHMPNRKIPGLVNGQDSYDIAALIDDILRP